MSRAPRPQRIWSLLHQRHDALQSLQAVATTAAVLLAGFWTLRVAHQFRDTAPRVALRHEVVSWKISDAQHLVRIHVQVTNTGKVLIAPVEGRLIVQPLLPLSSAQRAAADGGRLIYDCVEDDGTQLPDCTPGQGIRYTFDNRQTFELGGPDRALEPGETDSFWRFAVLAGDVEVVEVFSRIKNAGENNGWLRRARQASSGLPLFGQYLKPPQPHAAGGWFLDSVHNIENGSRSEAKIPSDAGRNAPRPFSLSPLRAA